MNSFQINKQYKEQQTGITLIEVLLALTISGGVILSVSALISQNARFMTEAQDRLLASIAAENLMVEEFANRATPTLGSTENPIDIGRRRFLYTRTAQSGSQGLVQIDLELRRNEDERVLARLSAVRVLQ
ncbi:MAG: type II secretion system protein [Pseudomonadota bacterium]